MIESTFLFISISIPIEAFAIRRAHPELDTILKIKHSDVIPTVNLIFVAVHVEGKQQMRFLNLDTGVRSIRFGVPSTVESGKYHIATFSLGERIC